MKTVIAGALSALLLGGAVTAAYAQVSPEDQIEIRQAGFSYMAWNMGKIKAQVIDGSVEYNQQQVSAAANAIDAIANSGMGALFGPGTEKDIGDLHTRADPALFENMQDMAELAGNLGTAASNLAAKAEAGDQDEIRVAFGEVGKSCKSCHEKYRME
ncbi:MAG TPA: cytochrome c [Pseudomonas sabulinigri]|mgnify:FL=1|uniref:Cytochrome c domain-containing protein n=1 Tax=marine sediment metagenome TaxID=412755 RepID=A0A0F9VUT9_9ZZZZ|nr:cytochrome c [Halopseudomonas sabulinigri]HEC52855.1 cytochrome c [Halopseudomonas sabulinigri]|tara:strand:- start:6335 stop:6805 length:471 start_codon:yes stop_codon:yes gene_type:complete